MAYDENNLTNQNSLDSNLEEVSTDKTTAKSETTDKVTIDNGPQPKAESKASRLDAAKAFYRSLYAGEEAPANDFGQPSVASSKPCSTCEFLQKEVSDMEKKLGDSQGLYKRMAADFENYRKRVERERDEYKNLGIQRAIESVLPALDDLDRAKSALNSNLDSKSLLDNLSVVFNSFIKCFESIGVKQFDSVGQIFDPRLHEPVQEIPTNEFPDNTVIHELRRGYSLNDKIIRPSLVNVASRVENVDLEVTSAMVEEDKKLQNTKASVSGIDKSPLETAKIVTPETITSDTTLEKASVNEKIVKLFGTGENKEIDFNSTEGLDS